MMKLMNKTLAMGSISLLALSACTEEHEKARQGALIGAGVGALTGVLTSDDTSGTIKRAAVGAALGGLIGNELDKQEADLRGSIGDSGALITNTGDRLIVTLPDAITFDTDSVFVRPSIRDTLVRLSANLDQYPNSTVEVVGHTDSVGDASYNQGLSVRRANAVANVLIGSGTQPSRLRVYGLGESSPIASNDTELGRSQNRRVEIVIIPNG